MRLNKSFIVRRSVTGRREKMAAYQLLSAYINHSIRNDCASIWIAQAEGRAKDGDDRTESAILKRSEEHTSELQSLMRNSYAVFCLKKKNTIAIEYIDTSLKLYLTLHKFI